MDYPEEIYATRDGGMLIPMLHNSTSGVGWGRQHAYDVGFAAGLAKGNAEQADPLKGYSNLTAAISAGEPIDWEKLDKLKVQCVHPDMGTLRGTLKRRESAESDSPNGWWNGGMDCIYVNALIQAWFDEDGWTLWVEGEVPLPRKTADQLEVGTYFLSKFEEGMEHLVYVGSRAGSGEKTIYYAPEMTKSYSPPYKWVVLEEYGTFQKPEGK